MWIPVNSIDKVYKNYNKKKPISIFGNIISNMEKGKLIGGTKVNLLVVKFTSDGKLVNFTKGIFGRL